jgi:hypothetical protein
VGLVLADPPDHSQAGGKQKQEAGPGDETEPPGQNEPT